MRKGIRVLLWVALSIGTGVQAAETESASVSGLETAIFAGGCFWCMEHAFDEVEGVVETTSGYTGGEVADPNYREVSAGGTGHFEALRVRYDPARVSYEQLLSVFWRNIDPTVDDRQFCDVGSQYRAAIFYLDEAQRAAAEASYREVVRTKTFDAPILTPRLPAMVFYPAEEYHQDYHHKNPVRYKFYRYTCGRDQRLEVLWGARQK